MKKILLVWFMLMAALSLACNFSFSTANIAEATLAKDAAGSQPADIFNPDDVIYALVSLQNAPDDTTLKAVWTAVEAEGTDPNFMIDETTITSGDDTIHFNLTNNNLWPIGKYKVDLYINDKLDRTLEFTVEGDAAAQAPTATPSPTATPEPTATPAPTQTPAGDSLAVATEETAVEPAADVAEEPAGEFEPLPLQAEPYSHPSGDFTFAVPQGWELQNETETSAGFSDGQTYLSAVFTNGQIVYNKTDMQNYIDLFIEAYLPIFRYLLNRV